MTDIKNIDPNKKENVSSASHFSVGFAATYFIKELKSKYNSTPVTIISFKGNVYEIAKTIINNLFEPFHARSVF